MNKPISIGSQGENRFPATRAMIPPRAEPAGWAIIGSNCPPGEIRRMADFLEIEISDETLARVVNDTSFGAMRQRAIAAEVESGRHDHLVVGPRPFLIKVPIDAGRGC